MGDVEVVGGCVMGCEKVGVMTASCSANSWWSVVMAKGWLLGSVDGMFSDGMPCRSLKVTDAAKEDCKLLDEGRPLGCEAP